VGDAPVTLARRWVADGAEWLHVIDLDGAIQGTPRHLPLVRDICRAVSVPVQVGGGLRTVDDLHAVFDAGAERAILGTAALAGDLLAVAVALFGDRIAVALDARDGMMALEGWQRTSSMPVIEAAQRFARLGSPRFIYTDVARDGMLAGPNIGGLVRLVSTVGVPVILSGGITTLADVRAAQAAGAEGAIIGRALYSGRLALREVLAALGEKD
jgi:phosphoribosylformimino-5-aminoimidazole carboxamide ribotide isomerase